MPNKEEPTTTASQHQGWANLYKMTEENARYARAYTRDSEQAQAQLQAKYAKNDYYHDALKLLKVPMDNLDNLDKIKSYFSRGVNERSTPPGKRRRRQEPGHADHGGTCNNKMFQKY